MAGHKMIINNNSVIIILYTLMPNERGRGLVLLYISIENRKKIRIRKNGDSIFWIFLISGGGVRYLGT